MTMEFIPGVYYPIEMLDQLPHGNWFTKGSFVSIGWIKQTHFTVDERTVIESPKPKLPTVPEFIQSHGLQKDDTLTKQDGWTYSFAGYIADPIYPITTLTRKWTHAGWLEFGRDGNRQFDHIIHIERNGVMVAEGQVYDD